MKILMVLTSHDKLGNTGNKTGFWLEEFAAPYYVFKDAGAEITLASPRGGQPPLDPSSDADDAQTEATKRFKGDEVAQKDLASTAVLSSVSADGFDAIFYPGGHGPLWDLAEDGDSKALIETFAASDRPIGAVCHAPAVFRHPQGRGWQTAGVRQDRHRLHQHRGRGRRSDRRGSLPRRGHAEIERRQLPEG